MSIVDTRFISRFRFVGLVIAILSNGVLIGTFGQALSPEHVISHVSHPFAAGTVNGQFESIVYGENPEYIQSNLFYCFGRQDGAKLQLELSTGADHELGLHAFAGHLGLLVRIMKDGVTTPLATFTKQVQIDELAPQITWEIDLGAYQTEMDRIFVDRIGASTTDLSGAHPDRVELRTSLIYRKSLEVRPIFIGTPQPVKTVSMGNSALTTVRFSWFDDEMFCPYPRIQLQVLRLFDHALGTVDHLVSTTIDWSQAGTYDFYGALDHMDMTLTEGTGFYAWRARQITDYYPGGVTNPNNWGPWTSHPFAAQGATLPNVTSTTPNSVLPNEMVKGTSLGVPYVFHYTQFDQSRNWSYSRTFSEGRNAWPTTIPWRVGESMTYGTGLLQVEQEQTRSTEGPYLIAGQTVQDMAGRPALRSMPVPVKDRTTLGYVPNLLDPAETGTQIPNEYAAEDFDTDQSLTDNRQVNDAPGSAFSYYSEYNTDQTEVPSAEAYPFSRTRFHPDGRVKQTSAPGTEFSFENDVVPLTTRTSYTAVSTDELARIFGTEMYHPASVSQTLTVDPNGVVSSTYTDKEGRTLATSLIKTDELGVNDPSRVQLGLASEEDADFQISDVIEGDQDTGPYSTESVGQFAVDAADTDVTISYTLQPGSVEDECANFCVLCDYYIEFFLLNTADPSGNLIPEQYRIHEIPDGWNTECTGPSPAPYTFSFIVPLDEGIYELSRRITTNNASPVTFPAPGGVTTEVDQALLDQNANDLAGEYSEDELFSGINALIVILEDPAQEMDAFYAAVAPYQVPGWDPDIDTEFTLDIGCTPVTFPVQHCPECVANDVAFLDLLEDMYDTAIDIYNLTHSPTLAYFPINEPGPFSQLAYPQSGNPMAQYTRAQLSALIENMLDAGYTCEQLRGCWIGAITAYTDQVALTGNGEIQFQPETIDELEDQLGGNQINGSSVTLTIMDIFLDCTGRNIQGWTTAATGNPATGASLPDPSDPNDWNNNTDFGYLTHAHAFTGFDPTTGTTCTDVVLAFSTIYTTPYTWYQEATVVDPNPPPAPAVPATYPVTGWDLFYNCAVATTSNNGISLAFDPTDPDAAAEALQNIVNASIAECSSSCLQHYDAFMAQLIELYAEADPLPSTSDLICMANSLVADCIQDCQELHVMSNSNEYGTGPQETIERIQNILTGHFDISIPVDEVCENGDLVLGIDGEVDIIEAYTFSDLTNAFNEALDDLALFVLEYEASQGSAPNHGWTHGNGMQEGEATWSFVLNGYRCDKLNISAKIGPATANSGCSTGGGVSFACLEGMDLNDVTITAFQIGFSGSNPLLMSFNYGNPALDGVIEPSTMADMQAALLNGFNPFTHVRGRFIVNANGIDFVDPEIIANVVTVGPFPLSSNSPCTIPFDHTGTTQANNGAALLSGHPWTFPPSSIVPCAVPETVSMAAIRSLLHASCQIQYSHCLPVCIQWSAGLDFTNFPPPDAINIVTCESVLQADYAALLNQHMTAVRDAAVADLQANYISTCSNPANIADELRYSYSRKQHHYTLYYYDRAGNLITTIPPEGVKTQDEAGLASNLWPTTPTDHLDDQGRSHKTIYTHNSQGQVLVQTTPNGGTTHFYYDVLGRLRVSQNAKQAVTNTYSYTRYDALGRPIEAGESTELPPGFGSLAAFWGASYGVIATTLSDHPEFPTSGTDITRTFYSEPAAGITTSAGSPQQYLNNRVSYSYSDADGSGSLWDRVSTYYSYDPHGNVDWMVQELPFLGKQEVAYEYDLLSGRVLKVKYNEGRPDQFFHRYDYDANGRILRAETSADDVIWDKDATYSYYPHGPLDRVLIGEDKVQGLDHTYTIQGWLKGINDPLLQGNDHGHDGMLTSTVGRDAFGMMLSYYDGDFTRSTSVFSGAQPGVPAHDLYNGNIRGWGFNSQFTEEEMSAPGTNYDPALEFAAREPLGFAYRYDVLNRLRTMNDQVHSGAGYGASSGAWKSAFKYDGNGNFVASNSGVPGISRYDQNATDMDAIHYTYDLVKPDQLTRVTDAIDGTGDDLYGQHDYQYDAIGQLTEDAWGGSENVMEWTPRGKVRSVQLHTGRFLNFLYNANGNRVLKIESAAPASLLSDVPSVGDVATYYVHDAQGNIMATYRREITDLDQNTTFEDHTELLEQPIYGSSRVGQRADAHIVVREGTWNGTVYTPGSTPINAKSEVFRTDVATYFDWFQWFGLGFVMGNNTVPDDPLTMETWQSSIPWAMNTSNQYRGEDINGSTLFKVTTVRQNWLWTNYPQAWLLDRNGVMMYNSNGIYSHEQAATLSAQDPNNAQRHFMFTIGEDNNPYLNTIDLSMASNGSHGEILTPKNLPLRPSNSAASAVFGRCMAVIDDRTSSGNSMLYLKRYKASQPGNPGVTEIIGIDLQGWSNTSNVNACSNVLASYPSSEVQDHSEMQVSPDGKYLAVCSRIGAATLTVGGFPYLLMGYGNYRIQLYSITPDHQELNFVHSYDSFNSRITSLDFSPDGTYLYYVQTNMGQGSRLNRLDVPGLSVQEQVYGHVGDVRRTTHQQMLLTSTLTDPATAMANTLLTVALPNAPVINDAVASIAPIWTAPYQTLLPHIALQPLIIHGEHDIFTRYLDQKQYELTDHLGNVRVVVSDRKLADYNETANTSSNYRALVASASDYYPFGSLLPGRNYSSDSYRYLFQGQEHDDEINGSVGTSYSYEYRMHDPRVGRFLSIDPLVAKYPYWTPYAFSGNRVIDARELEGLEPTTETLPGGRQIASPAAGPSGDPSLAEGSMGSVDGQLCNYHCGITNNEGITYGEGWYNSNDYTRFAFSPNSNGGNELPVTMPRNGVVEQTPGARAPLQSYSGVDPNSGRDPVVFGAMTAPTFFPGANPGLVPVYPEADVLMIGRAFWTGGGSALAPRGGAGPVMTGQAGELAVSNAYDIGLKQAIQVNGRMRIPDGLTATVLSEVKNVASQSFTRQLRDFSQYAVQNGLRFDLYTRPSTILSRPLQQAVQDGLINLRTIP